VFPTFWRNGAGVIREVDAASVVSPAIDLGQARGDTAPPQAEQGDRRLDKRSRHQEPLDARTSPALTVDVPDAAALVDADPQHSVHPGAYDRSVEPLPLGRYVHKALPDGT
jgi:hypothetical protein